MIGRYYRKQPAANDEHKPRSRLTLLSPEIHVFYKYLGSIGLGLLSFLRAFHLHCVLSDDVIDLRSSHVPVEGCAEVTRIIIV